MTNSEKELGMRIALLAVTLTIGRLAVAAEPASSGNPVAAATRQKDALRTAGSEGKHPLIPVIQYARKGLFHLNQDFDDYTCVIIKRERVAGKLSGYHKIRAKVRHGSAGPDSPTTPFSFHLNFLSPTSLEGREVLYVEGERNGDMLVRRGGTRLPNMTLRIDPQGALAMKESRYPATDIGIKNLLEKVIGVLQEEIAYGECKVRFLENARVNDRVCTHIEVQHPVRRSHFRYHMARVFIDRELQVPIYFAAYDWPAQPGGKPILLEEYAYTQLKVNCGLTDRDFDSTNTNYGFQALSKP